MNLQVDTDFSNDLDVRVMLLVHDTRPPFLDGRVIFTKQAEAVMPLRDPTSDLAVIAKTGSKLVKEIRDKKNEGKSRQRFWEVAGSKMGKITGQLYLLPHSMKVHHCKLCCTFFQLNASRSVQTFTAGSIALSIWGQFRVSQTTAEALWLHSPPVVFPHGTSPWIFLMAHVP